MSEMTGAPQSGARPSDTPVHADTAGRDPSHLIRSADAAPSASGRESGGMMAGGLAAVSLWGLAPVATRALLSEAAPLPVLVLRQMLASCVLLPWALPMLLRLDWRSLARLVIAGVLGMV